MEKVCRNRSKENRAVEGRMKVPSLGNLTGFIPLKDQIKVLWCGSSACLANGKL
jgi:hypothetical protein